MIESKLGKKDPCPCGSGKKYKRCCLEKDEAAGKSQLRAPQAARSPNAPAPPQTRTPSTSQEELTPDEKWWQDFAERCEEAKSGADALELLRLASAEGPPLDEDLLLDYLGLPIKRVANDGMHAECMAVIDALAARFPVRVGQKSSYFERWRFESALERADVNIVAEARRFGPHVHAVIDLVIDLPLRLAWEGKVTALRALTEAAWGPTTADTNLMGSALDEWGGLAVGAVLLDHLERGTQVRPDDPALLADIAPFEEGADAGSIVAYARRWLTLLDPPGNLPIDPSLLASRKEGDREARFAQLQNLTAMVASRLRAENGWSPGRGWLFVREMPTLVLRCEERDQNKKVKGAPLHGMLPPPSVLVDKLLEQTREMFATRLHAFAAVVQGLPAWTQELATRGWIPPLAGEKWLRESMALFQTTVLRVPAPRRGPLERELLDFMQKRS